MYIPKYAEISEIPLLHQFIEHHSFGTLITATPHELHANHFPFVLDREGGFLLMHLARANPHSTAMRDHAASLVIFRGPHAYISPTLYENELNVPTWNYTAVHAHCRAELVGDDELEEILQRSVDHFEKNRPNPWKYELPADFRQPMLEAIVGVRLRIEKLEGKFKLSQNRSPEDYRGVFEEFQKYDDDNSRELFRYMNSGARS
jgi:transcriptional regulator